MVRKLWDAALRFVRRLGKDAIGAYAAQAAFFILISFFPFAMLLITLLQILPFSKPELLHLLTDIFPQTLTNLLDTTLQDIWSTSFSSITLILITAFTALWASSKGFFALTQGLNAVYRIEKRRPWLVQKLLSLLYTLAFAVLLLITLGFLVFGNELYGWIVSLIPGIADLALLIISIRTFVGFAILALFFLFVYLFIPNRKFKKEQILMELPGAMLSAAGWIGFSYLYAYYIENFGHNSFIYGSLTAVVLLMLWLYFCMYIMLIGAEINEILRNGLFDRIIKQWRIRHPKKEKKKKEE